MMRTRMLTWFLVVVVLIGLVGCGSTPSPTEPPPTEAPAVEEPTEAPAVAEPTEEAPAGEAKTLKIGALVSLEFPLGVDMQKELDALIPVINERGGITVGGEQYNLELILYDTKLNPETGRAGAERLVFEDEVDFILGDETTDAWLSVTEPEKVLVVAMTPSPAVLDPQYNYVFQAGSINSSAGAMWGWLADNRPELKTVVAMFPDDVKGQAEAGMLEQIAATFGFELLDVLYYEPGTSDFSTYATRLATLNPDIYTTAAGGPVQDALSMRAMRDAGWDGQIFLKTTLSPQKMSEIIDLSLVEGTIAGMIGTTVPEPPPIAQELIDAYTAAYGAWDSPEVLHVLDFYVLMAAIEAADSLDVDDVAAALLGGLEFDSPANPGFMASRPDMGNDRAIDTMYEATIGQIVNGEAVVIGEVPFDQVIEYNNQLRGLEPAPEGDDTKSGGIFRYNYFRPAGRFGDPLNIRHSDHHYGELALQKLVQPDEEQPGAMTGVLAESWELADDRSSYTFQLREGVTFHDGTPFNAEAVKWNLERAMGAGRPQFSAVESVEVVDDHTVQVNLKQWTNLVLSDFGTDLGYMISPTAFEANEEGWADTHPVGTGPWKLKELKPSISISFDAFEDYWIEGVPKLDGLEVLHIPDSMTQLAALQAGEIHAIYSLDPVSGSELQAMGEWDIYTEGAPNILITMNTEDSNSVWSDIRMRQALEYAVDKAAITDALGFGFQSPLYEVIHSISEVTDPGTTPREYDPEKAKALIAEAGYADGIDIVAVVNADGPQDSNVALQAQLAEVGINIELNPTPGAVINQMAFEPLPGNDIRLDAMRGGPANPLQGVVEGLAATSIYFPGVARPEGFQDLVDEALLLDDPAAVIELVGQMEKLAYDDVMLAPLWSGSFIAASTPYLKDVFFFTAGGPHPRFEYAWLGEGVPTLGEAPDFEPAPPMPPPAPPKDEDAPEGEGEAPPPAATYECANEGGVYAFNYGLPADRIGVPKNVIHYNHTYSGLSIEGLVQASNEEAGVYLPRLATSWELAPDKSSYTFHLREGVTFHDGSKFNAEVAKWNLDNFLAAGTPLMGNVTDVEVIDDYTIKLNLSSWDSVLMDDIARASGMISKEAFEANGEEWANYNPIGTGPWVLKEFERQQKLVYEKFEDYWVEGLPCLDGLVIEQVPDPMTAIAMIKAGDVEALYQTDPMTANELMSGEEGYKIDIFPGLHNTIVMNTVDPESVWSDIRMREALEYAIDKQAIADATGFGFSKPYYEIIHSIHEAGGNPGTTPRTYDPDKARALIAEAGYADGIDTTLTFSSRQPPDAYAALQQYLGEVGINIELNPMDDVALNQMSFEPPEGNSLRIEGQRGGLLNPLGSTKETLTSSSVYFPGLKRAEGFDELVQKALDSEDPAEQMMYLEQAEKLVYDDVMFVPLWNMPILSVDDGTTEAIIWAFGGTPSPRFDWANQP